jgi:hypothetical protein
VPEKYSVNAPTDFDKKTVFTSKGSDTTTAVA